MKAIHWLSACCIAALTACASHPAPLQPTAHPHAELMAKIHHSHPLRVLFVGNSYCFGAPAAFKRLAIARGHEVVVDQDSFSGWTLARHARNPETLDRIHNKPWDIVVIQEQSRIPSLPEPQRTAAMTRPLQFLTKEIRASGAVPVLYQSWGRRDGDPAVPHDTFLAMNKRVRAGYHAASREAGDLVIVPVGDVWQREVTAGRGARLYISDGSHPSREGNRLIAEAFYHAFFGS